MKKLTVHQIITILVTVLTITLNILANALPFNGQGTGEISDRFDILFVPAGYVFAIWFFIYVGLIAFTVFQAKPSQAENPLLRKIAPAYWIANMANNIWLFLWHWNLFPLTLLAMITILISLLYLYMQFMKNPQPLTKAEKWLVKLPFSVYLGWISVATIANVSQVLFFANWSGFGISATIWTVIMVLVATIIGILMLVRERNMSYALVLVWSFIGIAAKQSGNALIANTAYLGTGLLLIIGLLIGFRLIKKGK